MERIQTLMEQRSPIYERCADISIDVSDLTFEEILEQITGEKISCS